LLEQAIQGELLRLIKGKFVLVFRQELHSRVEPRLPLHLVLCFFFVFSYFLPFSYHLSGVGGNKREEKGGNLVAPDAGDYFMSTGDEAV
jgi:hypothetical protein